MPSSTPDEPVAELPDFPYIPGTARWTTTRAAPADRLDRGRTRDADPILMLHGEPTWSFCIAG